jgi:hypothetical protein
MARTLAVLVSCGAVLFADAKTGKYAALLGSERKEALMKLAKGEEQPYVPIVMNPRQEISRDDVYWLSCGKEYEQAYNTAGVK